MSGYNEEHAALERLQPGVPVRLLQQPFRDAELFEQIRATLAWSKTADVQPT